LNPAVILKILPCRSISFSSTFRLSTSTSNRVSRTLVSRSSPADYYNSSQERNFGIWLEGRK
jgi:hypothetical protein